MLRRSMLIALVGALFVGFVGVVAFAGDGGDPGGAPPPARISVLETINKGGLIGYIIILLSVIALALAIEHAVNLRSEVVVPPEMVDELEKLFEEEEYEEALDLCATQRTYITKVVGAGLSKIGGGYIHMTEAMDEAAAEEEMVLQQKIGWLSLIGNISPMLGLFGTVTGMIRAFKEIERLGANVQPKDLGKGISEALVTTLLGLAVAIPTLSAYIIFRNKVQRIIADATVVVGELMDRFRPTE